MRIPRSDVVARSDDAFSGGSSEAQQHSTHLAVVCLVGGTPFPPSHPARPAALRAVHARTHWLDAAREAAPATAVKMLGGMER